MDTRYPSLPLLRHTDSGNFFLIAGPCVVESEALCMQVAETACRIADKHRIPYIFKASFRKENRSRLDSFTGIGDREGLAILQKVRRTFQVPVLTDIHESADAALAAEYDVDVLQIPAFLCRQTHLLQAAAATGRVVNVKKGQFLAPSQMAFVAGKLEGFGNRNIMLTDRGTQFGYADLIVDVTGFPQMRSLGYPFILDVTHALQQPNQSAGVTGGRPALIPTLAAAGVAAGLDGLFLETHPQPSQAKSDGANMLPLAQLDSLLARLVPFHALAHQNAE